jgi:hypothetical protein
MPPVLPNPAGTPHRLHPAGTVNTTPRLLIRDTNIVPLPFPVQVQVNIILILAPLLVHLHMVPVQEDTHPTPLRGHYMKYLKEEVRPSHMVISPITLMLTLKLDHHHHHNINDQAPRNRRWVLIPEGRRRGSDLLLRLLNSSLRVMWGRCWLCW